MGGGGKEVSTHFEKKGGVGEGREKKDVRASGNALVFEWE